MNDNGIAKGLKGRDVTQEWIDMAWPGFNGYTAGKEGVSKDDLLETLYDVEIAI